MKAKSAIVVLASLLLFFAGVGQAQQGSAPLKNDDIIQMVGAGLGDDAIIDLIQTSNTAFDFSTNAIVALKKAKVSDKVIRAMKAADVAKQPAAAPAAPAPQTPQAAAAPAPAAPPANDMPGVPAGMGFGQMASVSLASGGNMVAMRPSMAQVAQTKAPQGAPGANPLASMSLDNLAMQSLSFASVEKLAKYVPMVSMGSKLFGAFSKKSQSAQTETMIWGLPGRVSSNALPTTSPAFDIQYGNIGGIDPDQYAPELVKLVQTKDNWRLVGASAMSMGATGPQPTRISEQRVDAKATKIDRGHVRLEPSSPLDPGEYAIVLRSINPQPQIPQQGMAAPGMMGGAQLLLYTAWDFSVPAPQAQPAQ